MDRREFIKACSVVLLMQAFAGCRRVTLDTSSSMPSLEDFVNEVKMAASRSKPGFDLVQIPMPSALKQSGASPLNRFGMAIDLDACNGCGKCLRKCPQKLDIIEELKKVKKEFEIPGYKYALVLVQNIGFPIYRAMVKLLNR